MKKSTSLLLAFSIVLLVSCDNGFDYPAFAPEPFSSLDDPFIFYTAIDPLHQKGLFTSQTRQSMFGTPIVGDDGYFCVYDFGTKSISRRLRYLKENLAVILSPCLDKPSQRTYFPMGDGRIMLWDNASGSLSIFMSGLSTGPFPQLAATPSVSGKLFLLSNLILASDDKRYGMIIDPTTRQVIWEPHLTEFSTFIGYVDPIDDRFFCRLNATNVEMVDISSKTVTSVRLAEDGYHRSSMARIGNHYIVGQVPYDPSATGRPYYGLPEICYLSASDFSLQSKVVIGAELVPVASGSDVIAIYPYNGELYVVVSSGTENTLLKWSAVDGKFLKWSVTFPSIWGLDRILSGGKVYFIANDNFASFFFNALDLSTGEVSGPETVWVY
ncbi:MAG TPA: hypothetical protein VMV83_15970 [Rectinemataceae bacterium]|nr:hypothetical protein [Rectinemataceae bacterium]